jgi:hypothetical protein
MTDKFYLLTVNTEGRPVPNDAIERVLAPAKDWLRFSANVYFFRSGLEAEYWFNLIRPGLHADDQLLVNEIMTENRQGWLKPLPLEWFTTRSSKPRPGI